MSAIAASDLAHPRAWCPIAVSTSAGAGAGAHEGRRRFGELRHLRRAGVRLSATSPRPPKAAAWRRRPGSGSGQDAALYGHPSCSDPGTCVSTDPWHTCQTSGRFGANSAWILCAVIAHNLLRAAGVLAGDQHTRRRGSTLRRRIISVAARLTRPQRRPMLHLPSRWPWSAYCLHCAQHHRIQPTTDDHILINSRKARPEQTGKRWGDPRLPSAPLDNQDQQPPTPINVARRCRGERRLDVRAQSGRRNGGVVSCCRRGVHLKSQISASRRRVETQRG